jgi:hypothetical protein
LIAGKDASGWRRPKLTPQQTAEIAHMVSKGGKTAADAARLFSVHPPMVSRLPDEGIREIAANFYAK